MIYKLAAAALVVASGEALKLNGLGLSRRVAIAQVASLAVPLASAPAFAELMKASDGDIYKRADEGGLNSARAIERAKSGELVDGSSATCSELDALIAIDREAVQFEKDKLGARFGKDKKVVEDTKNELQGQIDKLKKLRKKKRCNTAGANLKQPTDFEVYKRADEDKLNVARAIERAKAEKLIDGSGATCKELERILEADRKAIRFEKEKVAAMTDTNADPADIQVVADAQKAIEKQVEKLAGLQASKGCN